MAVTSVLRYAAIGMATLSLAGFAAASTVTVSNTGPQSHNGVTLSNTLKTDTSNNSLVGVGNINGQEGQSGDVDAHDNTSVGGAVGSGAVTNANVTTTTATVTNNNSSAMGAGMMVAPDDTVSIDTTGPQSTQTVSDTNSATLDTTNNTAAFVLNDSTQVGESGNVDAHDNTTVGGLSSGAVTQGNTTTNTITVSNTN